MIVCDAARPDKIEIVGAAESRIQILRPCHARSPLARPSPGFHAPEFGHRFPDPGFQIPDPGSRFQIPVSRFRIPETQDIRYQNPRSGPTAERRPDPDQDTRFQAPAGRASALLPADAQKPDPAVAKAALGARRAGAVPHVPESGHRSRPGGGRGRGRRAGSEVRGGRRGEGGRGAGGGRPDTGVISTNERNPGNRP